MTIDFVLAALLVIAIWAVMIYLNWRFGAGYGTRSVKCPHKGQRAMISTSWVTDRGVSFCDVLQCSLLPSGAPISCDKGCMAQLKKVH